MDFSSFRITNSVCFYLFFGHMKSNNENLISCMNEEVEVGMNGLGLLKVLIVFLGKEMTWIGKSELT